MSKLLPPSDDPKVNATRARKRASALKRRRAKGATSKIGRPRVDNPVVRTSSYWRLRRYGITEDQYQQMLVDQGGACGICHRPMIEPHVDHCHETKTVRGLLCNDCNVGLGRFKDSPDIVSRALAWLEK